MRRRVTVDGVDPLELLPPERAELYREDPARMATFVRMFELRARWPWITRLPSCAIALLTRLSLHLLPPEDPDG